MLAKVPFHIGRRAAARRRHFGIRQIDLARQIGVGRQWVIALEQGRPNLQLELVLKAFAALGLGLQMCELGDTLPAWADEAAWQAHLAKVKAANRPRVRRSRAHLDRLRAQAAAYDATTAAKEAANAAAKQHAGK